MKRRMESSAILRSTGGDSATKCRNWDLSCGVRVAPAMQDFGHPANLS